MDLNNIDSRIRDIHSRLEGLYNTSVNETRDFSQEEGDEIDRLLAESKTLEQDRARVIGITNLTEAMASTTGRITEPDDVVNAAPPPPQVAHVSEPGHQRRVHATARDPKTMSNYGFPSFGSFAKSVMLACRKTNAILDPRLTSNAPASYMQEGVGEDGGFAVPPDYRSTIMQMIMGEDSLLSRTDRQQSSSNIWSQPVDTSTPWQATGGIKAYWEGEASQKTQSKPTIEQVSLRLNKLAAIVPVTDELREDAPAIDNYLMSRTPQAFDYAINEGILNGTGVGQPEGILNAAALITVAAEAGQAADTIHAHNIIKMWSRLYAGYRANAVWLVNQDVETQLPRMAAAATMPDGTTVLGPTATYWEPGALRNQNNFGLLYNRPVVVTESCSPLGDVGDIILADLSQYVTITKVGGLRSDISIHLWFDYDVTAFRFVFRMTGAPWLKKAIARKGANTNTLSAFVALAAR